MMPDLRIQQAMVVADARGAKVIARTDGFDAPEAERVAVLFGQRPAGGVCPLAHFACQFGVEHVAVVRVEDIPGSGGRLGFRFLVLGRDLYRHLGDPFAISDRYPADWSATGTLPDLAWPPAPLAERSLERLDAILKGGDGPLLLGAAQALVDGNRVRLARVEPDESLVRGLWQLLPDRTRADLWPASFAFSDELEFHFSVGPNGVRGQTGVLTEDAARDYPPSGYELNLQIAVESGDRAGLRRLLARRTADDTIRLGLSVLGFALLVALLLRFVV